MAKPGIPAPVAADLRFLLSVLRIVPELERSHDLVVHIAAGASHLVEDDLVPDDVRIQVLVQCRRALIERGVLLMVGRGLIERRRLLSRCCC